jgi:chemotaxis methyl-accepting protein methylase
MTAGWSELLLERCGLALRESQRPVLADLLQARTAALGLGDPASYLATLRRQDDRGTEWSEVVDRLVSHETSFFRHPESFEAIRTVVLPQLRRRPAIGGNRLALCSAGCSTGEEAYSLAMIALDNDPGGGFDVWGADLSRRALDVARQGRYPVKAAANVPPAHRRHLTADGDGTCAVVDDVRRRVRFIAANLFASCGLFMRYDLVVCQNVLIYFAAAAVPRALATLASRLTPGGYLLLGPGEAPAACPAGLEPVAMSGVRAFRRAGRLAREVRS